jgi:Zn-dependent peptidase ImmA (M78 family)
MSKRIIRRKVQTLIKKYGTSNPYELCEYLGVYIYHKDLGKNIMGLRTMINRAPMILLNERNSEKEDYSTCLHELGHHCCNHKNNADGLTRKNLRFIAQGEEFEANYFMVSVLTYESNLAEYPTRQAFLDSCGIPHWAERYVDWRYLETNMDFNSFNSYY